MFSFRNSLHHLIVLTQTKATIFLYGDKSNKRNTICELGKRGVLSGRPQKVRAEDRTAVEWLEERALAFLNAKGRLVFQSSALVFATVLSKAERVRDPANLLDCSLWSLRRKIVSAGWEEAQSGKHASVENKQSNKKCEHHADYVILLERCLVNVLLLLLCTMFLHLPS